MERDRQTDRQTKRERAGQSKRKKVQPLNSRVETNKLAFQFSYEKNAVKQTTKHAPKKSKQTKKQKKTKKVDRRLLCS